MVSRRSGPLLPAALVAVGVWLVVSLFAGPAAETPRSFVTAQGALAPGALREGAALRGQRRTTAARGFKEDFDAWKSALSDDEKAMIQEQAEGEFNKKFRKSDAFKKDLPEEKIKSFSKILGKFFDAEAEDYKKEVEGKAPDYDGLLKKAAEGGMDFSLKASIVEVDRDADRRYEFASFKIDEYMKKGEKYPQSSPQENFYQIQNNDTESHEYNLQIIEFLKKAAADPSCPEQAKKYIAEWDKNGIPPMGKPFLLAVPEVMVKQSDFFAKAIPEMVEAGDLAKGAEHATFAEIMKTWTKNYVESRDFIEHEVEEQKAFFRSQKDMPGKTKADVLKEIWAEMPKFHGGPVPPLDDEMLAELAQYPASEPEELLHNWGTADKLYKSEAIDAFGGRYLLGIYETKKEAADAFLAWNKEYEGARVKLKEEMKQWSKQEQARLDADVENQKAIKDVLTKD